MDFDDVVDSDDYGSDYLDPESEGPSCFRKCLGSKWCCCSLCGLSTIERERKDILTKKDVKKEVKRRYSCWSQFTALLFKKAILQKRNWRTNLCQILTPCILVGFVLVLNVVVSALIPADDNPDFDDVPVYQPIVTVYGPDEEDGGPDSTTFGYVTDENVSVGTFDTTGLLSYFYPMEYMIKENETFSSWVLQSYDDRFTTIPRDITTIQTIEYPPELDDDISDYQYVREPLTFDLEQFATKGALEKELFREFGDSPAVYSTAYRFRSMDYDQLSFEFDVYYNSTTYIGKDLPFTFGFMSNALAAQLVDEANIAANATNATELPRVAFLGYKDVPSKNYDFQLDLSTLAGTFFWAIILHQTLPIIVSAIVYEKEHRLREIMKMMGLKMRIYWIVQYLFDSCLTMLVVALLVAAGYACAFIAGVTGAGFDFFIATDLIVMASLFFLWSHLLVAMGMMMSVLFTKARSATIVAYFYILIMAFIGGFLVATLIENPATPYWAIFLLTIWPSFGLFRCLTYFAILAEQDGGGGYSLIDVVTGPFTIWDVYIIWIVQWALMIVLTLYLDQVLPGPGVKKHPLFPLFAIKRAAVHLIWVVRKLVARMMGKDVDEFNSVEFPKIKAMEEGIEVTKERERAHAAKVKEENLYSLRIVGVRKLYGSVLWYKFKGALQFLYESTFGRTSTGSWLQKRSPFGGGGGVRPIAVNNVSFVVEQGECIGILGPNGAGKTTLIHILSGLFSPTSGTAEIMGLSIRHQIDATHALTGMCPQHDVLWGNLTAKETLNFYARLKNMPVLERRRRVKAALKAVSLWKVRNRLSKKFSGGMKRRLSVAVSLIGDPRLVFLDEPSTGLDPLSKKHLWDVIREKSGQCGIVLTTHSMEEAEALCDRLIIMARGRVLAVGPVSELKFKYGTGYKLTIVVSDPEAEAAAQAAIEELLPGAALVHSLAGTMMYHIPKVSEDGKSIVLSEVFSSMESRREALRITDWGITNSSLEEVFQQIVHPKFNPRDYEDHHDHDDDERYFSESSSEDEYAVEMDEYAPTHHRDRYDDDDEQTSTVGHSDPTSTSSSHSSSYTTGSHNRDSDDSGSSYSSSSYTTGSTTGSSDTIPTGSSYSIPTGSSDSIPT